MTIRQLFSNALLDFRQAVGDLNGRMPVGIVEISEPKMFKPSSQSIGKNYSSNLIPILGLSRNMS